ncbi:hypothetical protein HYH03_008955 [Edaphochlamys debaryana]|uniref:Uridine kinase n=1 Tax=Edaphochlamys debaryana TaxID=47281 RepID=A0A835XZD2_9CHLO|nr:hypothetical protein HYH03_008955 [Edaphochlamys debaryana]|eukprot:KAG2492795.1 hypothetical protein HYH03_008955 [Edaphochlamys debaryana]
MLKSSNTGTVVVGIAGPSGSGKTAFSEKVKNLMPGVALISMDMYNDGSKVIDDNFDDPRLTDYELLLQNLADLRDGKEVQIPVYDFRSSKRVGYRRQPVPEARVVLVEGIYALSERLRRLMDLRVSITGGVHFDLVKRVMRDIQRSGQGPEEIIQQITDTVYPMYKAFIEPDLQTAHLRIVNSFNPFSGFMNATYILKSKKVPTLEQVIRTLEAHGGQVTQRKEVDIYDIYLLPPNEDPETCQSWLRMRNRDGRYSLMFEEWVSEGPFIISPRISFEVSVRILGGLMALGYEIGTIMKRTSTILAVAPKPAAGSGSGSGSAMPIPPLQGAPSGSGPSGSGPSGTSAGPVPDSSTSPIAAAVSTAAAAAAAEAPASPAPLPPVAPSPAPHGPAATAEELTVKLDDVDGLGRFVQLLGRDRDRVAALGRDLGLEGSYIPRSYIEQVQLDKLTAEFQTVTEDWKKKFSTKSGEVVMPDTVSGITSPTRGSLAGTYARSQSYHGGAVSQLSSSAPQGHSMPIPAPNSATSRPGSRPGSRVGSIPHNGGLSQQFATSPSPGEGTGEARSLTLGNGQMLASPRGGSGPESSALLVSLQDKIERMGGNTEQIGVLKAQLDAMVAQHRETSEQLAQLTAATSALAANLQATLAAAGGPAAASNGFAGGAAAPGSGMSAVYVAAAVAAVAVVAGAMVGRWAASR